MYTKPLPAGFFESLNDDTAHLFVVISLIRPQLWPFCESLEHGYYKPGTAENEKFKLYVTTWEGVRWAIVGIPLRERWVAERVAEQTGTRLADGVPHLLDGGAARSFPLKSRRTFTLEPRHDRPGPVVGDVITGNAALDEAVKKTLNDYLRGKTGEEA
jgi:hypothetical protein